MGVCVRAATQITTVRTAIMFVYVRPCVVAALASCFQATKETADLRARKAAKSFSQQVAGAQAGGHVE